jgi:hypothetical protein
MEENMSKSFIPYSDAAYDKFFKNICQYVNQKTSGQDPEWTHIPAAEITALNAAYAAWYTAYAKTLKPHTPAETAAKNKAKADSRKVLSRFIQVWIRGFPEVVTVEDLKNMGIPPIDPTRTPVPPPEAQPEADLTFPGIHTVELRNIRTVAGTGGGDPRSDWGVRIHYGILDPANPTGRHRIPAPPLTGEDLPHSTFTHKRKHRFDFDGDSGRTVYFSLKYENAKGGEKGEGPYGPILSATIP